MAAAATPNTESYDSAKDVMEFEDSKTGIKGLVDSGITTIPRFFIHPPETLSELKPKSTTLPDPQLTIPTIDLSGLRSTILEKIARASRELGLFQIINHGIEVEFLERMIGGIKGFHEQPAEIKARLYRRDFNGVSYFSDFNLLRSKAANWRDTLQVNVGPSMPELDEIPEICRREVVEWNQKVTKLGEVLMELLCEGLRVDKEKSKELKFLEGRMMVGHYYPYCPQPDLTVGNAPHTDPASLAILLQDQRSGLQVNIGEEWVDVKPIPGALIVIIGDLFQIMSNDEYKSPKHRVLANLSREPRISTVQFFYPSDWDSFYGPFTELITAENGARFRQFTYKDYFERSFTKKKDEKSLIDYYRLSNTL
ncbi:hypothetical protein ACOSP7_019429 [Xanthoceras sorbifolium]|uniref:Fe2OG dioxygenase domain-containing protein n=1 Tax=Xanthoceras sorbifolium TaxID=99658 RepID=A0ABQ8I3C1_9ROSI|nr:hypothetical protein JRO89_XS05G0217100 [Xanthoceras sorbifolium]